MSEHSPDLHPEYRALIEENAVLREELAHLLAVEYDLVHIEKPNLYALYQKKIGKWELQALHARVAALRVKRKLELARAAINRGRVPDWTEIEGQLELDFLTWQQKLAEAAEKLANAESRLDNLLPDENDRELKRLYYALVRKLHPDVHPNSGEQEKRLWLRVQSAYEKADIEDMRTVLLLVEKSLPADEAPAALDALRSERSALRDRVSVLENRIADIEAEPPFTLRRNLADEEWLAARRDEIEKSTAQYEHQRVALEQHLQTLFSPGEDDGKISGLN